MATPTVVSNALIHMKTCKGDFAIRCCFSDSLSTSQKSCTLLKVSVAIAILLHTSKLSNCNETDNTPPAATPNALVMVNVASNGCLGEISLRGHESTLKVVAATK